MINPFLLPYTTHFEAVPFDAIKNEHFIPALKQAIQEAKQEIEAIIKNSEQPNFENTILALELTGKDVDKVSNVLFNLNTAETNPEIQKITKEASPLLTEYGNDITLNQTLFEKIKAVFQQKDQLNLDTESQQLLEKTYKAFARNGANLNENDKNTLREIDKRKAELTLQFSENVLAETNAFVLEITDEADLAGLPASVLEASLETAQKMSKKVWVFTLHQPSYQPFMTYSDRRELREKMFLASMSKAFKDNENDNRPLVKEIVKLRSQRAKLLGYASHADFVLEERMATSPQKVFSFLDEILNYAKPMAQTQMQELTQYARSQGFEETQLQRWDFAYYAEKLKKDKYEIDDEVLRPYFKLENVVSGVFEVAKKLYGLNFSTTQVPVYQEDVTVYNVTDERGDHIALFYADFFPREGKKGGAWMTSFREQFMQNGKNIRPHVSIVCNFTKPTPTTPSLLTFGEVTTLFHEFGHALHGMLANTTYQSLSGTNVFQDFVELPSQILENWCYEKQCLDLFARHYETQEPIPQTFIQKIKESSKFLEGYSTLRQLSFGLLDMAWYAQDNTSVEDVATFERKILAPTELFPTVENTNMSCQFSHIFAGGYAAGYYSYKWAEVLDADAFELFQQKGIFDSQTANLFRENILSKGGSEHPMTLYKRFRGHEPSVKALLKRSGLIVD
jgi:Zn-dependent oligopeptidase